MSNFWTKLKMSANRKAWNWEGFRLALSTRTTRLGLPLLLLFALVLGTTTSVQAAEKFCSDYGGVVDGNVLGSSPVQITINTTCTFQNWPESNPLTATINYQTNDPTIYLIIFDNVYTAKMACANIPHKLWIVNSQEENFNSKCTDFMIPTETIDKKVPAPTAEIGVPFTYTLTLPAMTSPFPDQVGGPSPNDLGNIKIVDDLNATGAALTLVGTPTVSWVGGGAVSHTFTNAGGLLTFENFPTIPAGEQVVIKITAVLDNNTATNVAGTTFVNGKRRVGLLTDIYSVKWWYSRWIDLDGTGPLPPQLFSPLPGEAGFSASMTIVEPVLEVEKTSPATAINLGDTVQYTINAQNVGGGDAWNVKIADKLPSGMCEADPRGTLTATITQPDGSIKTLEPASDYYLLSALQSASYPFACQFSLTLTDDAGPIASQQYLTITYRSQLDNGYDVHGAELTNVAGATQWFSAKSTYVDGRRTYNRSLTTGTPFVIDHQDSKSVTAALSGYYFTKEVRNLTSREDPTDGIILTAQPGDILRYKLRVFNVDRVINGITITDALDMGAFEPGLSCADVTIDAAGYVALCDFTSGTLTITGEPNLNVESCKDNPDPNFVCQLVVEFDMTLKTSLANGALVSNQARLNANGGSFTISSDDPHDEYGVALPDVDGDEYPTLVEIQTPGPLTKANTQPTAAIGETFEYLITVPAIPTSVPLYDVRILDDLGLAAADLRFVSARVVSGGSWTLVNSGTDNDLIIEDKITGIDILPDRQAVIAITVELLNTATNKKPQTFKNTASYTYNRVNEDDTSIKTGPSGTSSTTIDMTIVEPFLTVAKTVSFIDPSDKEYPGDSATVGNVLEYRLAITNIGTSEAHDANIVDSLPPQLALVLGTSKINGSTVVDPFIIATATGEDLIWGRDNGDESLDIPAGQTRVLTYQVVVEDASSVPSFTNRVYVDWTSLPGLNAEERTGEDGISGLNNYVTPPASVTVNTVDNTSINKSVFADSYTEDTSTTPHIVRVGDTVTYDLTLNLQEYTTQNVVVEDALPVGMTLQSYEIIAGPNISYTQGVQRGTNVTGILIWDLGNITNTADNSSTNDTLVIRYVAKVVTDAPNVGVDYNSSNLLVNTAKLSYLGGNPDSLDPLVRARLNTLATTIDVRQPLMTSITKIDQGSGRVGTGTEADPYLVNIATDVMSFRLESCNDGLAPAYGVQFTDLLASQFNESSITPPVVTVGGGTPLVAGTHYTYTAPAGRNGTMSFVISAPVNPSECVTVDYTIGFHSDIAAGQKWSNQAKLPQYASLPVDGRLYDSSAALAQVWMSNPVIVQPLSKTLMSPAEATIGEEVVYQITVPAVPMNAALGNVVVSDTLHGALEYVSVSVAAPFTLSDIGVAPGNVSLTIANIPAGQQAVITLTARVANNGLANAGTSVTNTASYTYTDIPVGAVTSGSSAPLLVVEPAVTIGKTAANVTQPSLAPSAGDILRYTVTLTAAGGVPGDNFSSAFDAGIADTMSLGLAYVAGSARINGVAAEPVVTGTPQTLTWAGGIDIPEGSQVSVTYDVRVLDTVVAGQALTNSATAQWTSLDGSSGLERTGSGTPAANDYFTIPAATSLIVGDNNRLFKGIVADTYVDAPSTASDKIARIGDIATYRLTLNLGEGITRTVKVQDVLPVGMAYDSLVGITPTSGSSTFTYTILSQPLVDATGTLTWELGDVVNTPSNNNTPVDALIIEYRTKVLPDAGIAQAPTTSRINTATLSYLDASNNPVVDPTRLVASDTLTLQQPVMSPIVKLGNGASNTAATALNVNVATDTVLFHLQSCNTDGLAPAYGVQITDVLADKFNVTTITPPVVSVGGTILPAGAGYLYTPPAGRGGTMKFVLNTPVNPGQCVAVDYNVGFHTDFGANQDWNNSATLDEYWSLPAKSGQKYTPTGASQFFMTNQVIVQPLVKTLMSPPEATIGETVTYQITVPGVAVSAALDNVVVSDTLHGALEYVSASVAAPFTLTNNSVAPGNVSLTIANIPAGQQAVITLTARVANNDLANAGTSVTNTASYTYTDIPAGAVTSGSSAPLTIVEPFVSVTKSVNPATPPQAGTILTYTVNLTAASGANFASAFDTGLVDTLSLGLAYVANSARVDGTAVEPIVNGNGVSLPQTLTWNSGIDIPEGTTVAVSYQVRVLDTVVAGQTLANSVTAQWTGLDGNNPFERTGTGAPAYNDYFTPVPASISLTVADNNRLSKTIIADTYFDAPSTASDKIARIGDIATYRLTLNLGEGTTRNVMVQDVLPTGMAYDSPVSITASGNFTYSVAAQPAIGTTGTLTWDLGSVINAADGSAANDYLIIEYKAKVLSDAGIAQAPTTLLPNTATLSYLDASGNPVVDPTRLVASDTLTLRQPVMSPIVKSDRLGRVGTAATPLNVNVAADTMQFRLESCNTTGLAPAYNVQISDALASQLNIASLVLQSVAVGGAPLAVGDYSYTPPALRGGTMLFALNTPVNPGQCVTIDYNIGFHTDFGPNQTWKNSATLDEYWSLPAKSGQKYTPAGASQFFMSNQVIVQPLTKILTSAPEATIGETVTYQITVPSVSAALDNVVVSDTLHGALEYLAATVTLNGAPLAITPTQSAQTLTWNFGTIPAGQQAVIELTTRVVNNDQANAGTSIINTASYAFTGMQPTDDTRGNSAPLTIVEPSVTVTKSVNPMTPPQAGNILTYTVNLTATTGANFSSAFGAGLVDTLSPGLAYVANSARVGGVAVEPALSGQTLTWSGIDILEGTPIAVTYQVSVLDTVVAGQVLTNNVTAQWTGLAAPNGFERTGADGIGGLNDYQATAAAPPLTVPIPTLTLQKIVTKLSGTTEVTATTANPGDRLRYTLVIQNPSAIQLVNFSLLDLLEGLNATPMFQPDTIVVVAVPPERPDGTGPNVAISTGILNVTGLNIAPNETLTIVFDTLLRTDLKSGAVVLNQAELQGPWPAPIKSDDPNMPGAENPTQTVIPANGVVYDAELRKPLGGMTLTMRLAATGADLPASCFVDPSQQNQVTPANGEYKFDLKFNPTDCPEGADYLIAVTAVTGEYVAEPSLILLPASADAYSVPLCSADALPATPQCEAHVSTTTPTGTDTTYYLRLTLDSTANQLFNNHIPVDPKIEEKIYITKKSPLLNVTRGQLVPYTITFKNTLRSVLPVLGIVDLLPPGFKYVAGSSRYDAAPLEPVVNGRQLRWDNLDIGYKKEHTIKLLLVVGAGVTEGEYVNQAYVLNITTGDPFSEVATATVRIIPDPDFDCTDVIGKVFDDRDLNGEQDPDEDGLAGVRVVSARGLIATTDEDGRFHITCAVVPEETRGSNFILKLDDHSLPTGYRLTTENPLVQRATRGKMLRYNFGATIHRVVSIDIANGVFEPESTGLRVQWTSKFGQLIEELRKAPAVLRLSYLADTEREGLVQDRLEAMKNAVIKQWALVDGGYPLHIETEVFWRRGGPP
jgi:fimbrial isopeptide formation D2 family protein/uncharacterized repeat protein (TIGR01451 family)